MSRHWAKLHRDVCFGESNGKIIWQPRIGAWYGDKMFTGEPLPEPYAGMSLWDIHRALDCSARLYGWYNPCFKPVYGGGVERETVKHDDGREEIITRTPVGTLRQVQRPTPTSRRMIREKWEVETEDDLKIAMYREQHTAWRFDQEHYDHALAEVGDLGAPTAYLPRVSLQALYINMMSTEKAIYALYDWPETIAEYFQALDDSHDRLCEVFNQSPIDIVNFGDNLHCGTLPPDLYEKYVLPSYLRRCGKLHQAGAFVHSHWDGDTKALLPYACTSGLDGIEAITPKPQGDVTLEEVKDALGDDIFLIDGIPAIYFDTTYSETELKECTHQLIELFAPKLVLGISDEISSTGDIERIRLVSEIVDAYNAGQDRRAGGVS